MEVSVTTVQATHHSGGFPDASTMGWGEQGHEGPRPVSEPSSPGIKLMALISKGKDSEGADSSDRLLPEPQVSYVAAGWGRHG